MAMTSFEKALIKELQGIKKELHDMNKKETVNGQVDGRNIAQVINNGISQPMSNGMRGVIRWSDLL